MRILLVEDSRPVRMENERTLVKAGYEVLSADEGQKALSLAQTQRPDLILLDLLLPGMGGLEVLEKLKANPLTAQMPVVIVSSLCRKNENKLLEAGAEDYIVKNEIMEGGSNRLPNILINIVCRINRKRGTLFLSVPLPKQG